MAEAFWPTLALIAPRAPDGKDGGLATLFCPFLGVGTVIGTGGRGLKGYGLLVGAWILGAGLVTGGGGFIDGGGPYLF